MNMNMKRIVGTVCLFVATAGLATGQGPITRHEGVTSFVEADGVVSIEAEHYSRRIGAWHSVEGRNAGAGGFGIVPEYRLHARPSPFTPKTAAAREWPQQFPVAWGHPTAAAISALVTDVDTSRSAIFAYEAGAQMHGLVAPARRVGMFSPREAMTGGAWAWVDSAIAWALGGAASGRRAVLVAGSVTPSADDRALLARIRALGIDVRTLEHTVELDAQAYPELFIISESVHPDRVAARLRDVPVPVIVMKAFVYDRMGMVQSSPASWAGNAMMNADGSWTDRLGYHVYFTHPGNYRLWLLGRDGGDAGSDEVKVFFDTEQIDARSDDFFEMRLDGDNDAWIGTVEAGLPRRPVKRVGDSLRDGPGFSWLDWGTPTLHLTAGEHVLYVAGRSRGSGSTGSPSTGRMTPGLGRSIPPLRPLAQHQPSDLTTPEAGAGSGNGSGTREAGS